MLKNPIFVTKPVLPKKEVFDSYIKKIWDKDYLTNNGPLLCELEKKLRKYFDVKHVIVVSNGTIALHIAIKALELKGEIITTPFSFVATTSSIIWENCFPTFCDIKSKTFNIDSSKIKTLITKRTSAIIPTHVFGFPCAIEDIEQIAKNHNLKVIYDAAHCFGGLYKDKSIVSYGDISTISFHSTKLFHTIEGGALITNNDDLANKINRMRNFGYSLDKQDSIKSLGTNAKLSEFHAAMGLSLLPIINSEIDKRKDLYLKYVKELIDLPIVIPQIQSKAKHNYHYFPVIFESEVQLLESIKVLEKNNIYPRRYFLPSLNTLPFVKYKKMRNSESISKRVLCLPFYSTLAEDELYSITNTFRESFK